MVYFIAFFLLQILFNIFLYFYFKHKMHNVLDGNELKSELENLIISFNQYADRNISILEDKIKQATLSVQEFQKFIAKNNKLAFFHRSSKENFSIPSQSPRTSSLPTVPSQADPVNLEAKPIYLKRQDAYKNLADTSIKAKNQCQP